MTLLSTWRSRISNRTKITNNCFLIMNYALGAPAGAPNASDYADANKSEFVIDYVRVFQE